MKPLKNNQAQATCAYCGWTLTCTAASPRDAALKASRLCIEHRHAQHSRQKASATPP